MVALRLLLRSTIYDLKCSCYRPYMCANVVIECSHSEMYMPEILALIRREVYQSRSAFDDSHTTGLLDLLRAPLSEPRDNLITSTR